MKPTEFKIGDKTFEMLNTIEYENNLYIAYKDGEEILVGKLIINNNEGQILPVDEDLYDKVKELLF